MSTARYAALLGVLLVIGVAGVAQGANGDPLILGQPNDATLPTGVNGQFGAKVLTSALISGDQVWTARLQVNNSRIVRIDAGTTSKTVIIGDTIANHATNAVLCTVQTPNSGAVLSSAKISPTDPTRVTVAMGAPVTKDTLVACMRFQT
jgi:hypothetical protein